MPRLASDAQMRLPALIWRNSLPVVRVGLSFLDPQANWRLKWRLLVSIAKCRECGAAVSDAAKTCPKCGVAKPVKKTSLLVKVIIGLVILVALGQVLRERDVTTNSSGDAKRTLKSEAELAGDTVIKDFAWKTGGFNSVMILGKVTVENKNSEDIKDFVIECVHTAPSGTVIDRNSQTLYEVIPAGKSRTFKEVNMGFIHSQAASSSCQIKSVKRI